MICISTASIIIGKGMFETGMTDSKLRLEINENITVSLDVEESNRNRLDLPSEIKNLV